MSLASRLQQKLTQNFYQLEFEEFGETIQLAPMTVEQRVKIQKLKDENTQHIQMFLACAYDQEGNSAATNEKEVKALPDTIVGMCAACIMYLSQGASHETIDKFIAAYNADVNPTLANELEEQNTLKEDLNPNQ